MTVRFVYETRAAKGIPSVRVSCGVLLKARIRTVLLAVAACVLLAAMPQILAQEPAKAADSDQLIAYLNEAISWFRHTDAEASIADEPSEALLVTQDRQLAIQELRLAFDYARAEAPLITKSPQPQDESASASSVPATSSRQRLTQLTTQTAAQMGKLEDQIAAVGEQMKKAHGSARDDLAAQRDELNAELDLLQARYDTLRQLTEFIATASGATNSTGNGLLQKIAELEKSVPELQRSGSKPDDAAAQQSAATAKDAAQSAAKEGASRRSSSGIIGLIGDSVGLARKLSNLKSAMRNTEDFRAAIQKTRSPISQELLALSRRGDQLSAADSTDLATLTAQRKELETITARFKQLSSAAVPIGKQMVLLDTYSADLAEWHDAVAQQYQATLRRLAVRLAVVLGVVLLVFLLAELWRSATFKYVRDPKRRSQFLILRRVVLALVLTVVAIFALVTQAASLATYAGFLTAGLAVALQNVILAVVAYFFLIGRFGIHVGDRVTISGVTGDVMEIGLVRLHLMELSGTGSDMHPTGRVVVFSNAVILQPTANFVKQMPGADFVWHEVKLTLAPTSDHGKIEKRLTEAVMTVYREYEKSLHFEDAKLTSQLAWEDPHPSSRLRLTNSGLEVIIRYPVKIQRASEIDDRVTRALLAAIEKSPKLKLVPGTTPNLQTVAEGAD